MLVLAAEVARTIFIGADVNKESLKPDESCRSYVEQLGLLPKRQEDGNPRENNESMKRLLRCFVSSRGTKPLRKTT